MTNITIQEFNKLTSENFTARLAQAKKTDYDNKLKNIISNKN